MTRESYYTFAEAQKRAEEIAKDYQDAYISKCECDCAKFPLPEELDNWAGTTMGISIESNGECVAQIAWWENE